MGTPIGANHVLTAAHCLVANCEMVIANEREFARVQSLRVENWLRAR